MTHFVSFDSWIQVIDDLMDEYKDFPDKGIEGRVVAGMLIALGHRQMHHSHIVSCINRALSFLPDSLERNLKLSLINSVVPYYLFTGDCPKADQIMDLSESGAVSG